MASTDLAGNYGTILGTEVEVWMDFKKRTHYFLRSMRLRSIRNILEKSSAALRFTLPLVAIVAFTGCTNLPSQLIIVRFEDLKEVREVKADFEALESSLNHGEWATFDKSTMTITIS